MSKIYWLEDNSYTVSDWFDDIQSSGYTIEFHFEPNELVRAMEDSDPKFLIVDIMLLAGASSLESNIGTYLEKNDLGARTEFAGIATAHWALEKYPNIRVLVLTALPKMAFEFISRLERDSPVLANRLSVLSKFDQTVDATSILDQLGVKR